MSQADEIDLVGVARECMESAKGNWVAAAKLLRARAAKDRALAEELVTRAVWQAVRDVTMTTRRSILEANPDKASADGALRGVARIHARQLMDFQLAGGLALSEANRAQVIEQAELNDRNARTNRRTARWLHLVAEALPNDRKRVADVLTEEKLSAFLQSAEQES